MNATIDQGAPAAPPSPSKPKRSRQRRAWGTIIGRQDKPGFYARFTWDGVRYSRAAGPTKAVAAQKLSQAHAALASGKPIADVLAEVFGDRSARPLTFREVWPEYLTHARARKRASTLAIDENRAVLLLASPWAAKRLEDVRPAEIQAWADALRSGGRSGPTVNRYVALVSTVFRWAMRRDLVRENPCRKVEKESEAGRGREVYLTAPESRALLDATPDAYRPVLLAAVSTGMRAGELLTLTWADIDLDRAEINVRGQVSKSKRGRSVPMTTDLSAALAVLARSRPAPALDGSDAVFRLSDGSPITYPALRSAWVSLRRRCRGVLPESKRVGLRFHDLRHTAASLMVASGLSLFDTQKILGHQSPTMTLRYAHFSPENARAGMQRFGQALGLAPHGDARKTVG